GMVRWRSPTEVRGGVASAVAGARGEIVFVGTGCRRGAEKFFEPFFALAATEETSAMHTATHAGAAAAEPVRRVDLAEASRRYRGYVAAIGLRLLGRDDEVDDLVQEVFLAAAGARGLATLRDAEAMRGWLATVAVRVARRKLRLRGLRRALGL